MLKCYNGCMRSNLSRQERNYCYISEGVFVLQFYFSVFLLKENMIHAIFPTSKGCSCYTFHSSSFFLAHFKTSKHDYNYVTFLNFLA